MNEDPYAINSLEELRALYGQPREMAVKATLNYLHEHMMEFIRRAPFVAIASMSDEGLDVSPRGGAPGCVRILSPTQLAVADWPGNNKLESISNIILTKQCALLFLVPGVDMFFRVNGRARVTTDPTLAEMFKEGKKLPKATVVVDLAHAYFHCGKALSRSNLWHVEEWASAEGFPSAGKIMSELVTLEDLSVEELDAMYEHGLRHELY